MDSNQKFAEWLQFETFGDPELEKVVRACHEWFVAFREKRSPRWLTLLGASGTGKTHCLRRLWKWANGQVKTGRTVSRGGFNVHEDAEYIPHEIYWPDFVQRLKSGNGYELRNDMKCWPVVFLDDIGAERDPSGYAAEELNTLLGCRSDRWTLVTSNKEFDAIKAIDGRISSRLVRGKNICVAINTKDFGER